VALNEGVRIIAGKYRGRKLACPKSVTRPTLDRVREALFSILGSVADKSVADLYAGSGALGLEALSRGAARVVMVEMDRQAARVIRKNAEGLGASEGWNVVECAVEHAGARLAASAPLDLVLADPPWKIASQAARVVPRVVKGLLLSHATVVIGHAAREELSFEEDCGLEFVERRSWGDSALSFLRQSG
jgi:16S rRNA (guanine966-N2)-methyltransferase